MRAALVGERTSAVLAKTVQFPLMLIHVLESTYSSLASYISVPMMTVQVLDVTRFT